MSNARIEDGIWVRNVSWSSGSSWRTDIFKSVLADSRLKTAEFRLKNGPTVRVPQAELQRVLVGGSEHYKGKIWGPFNIDPIAKTVRGLKVQMSVAS